MLFRPDQDVVSEPEGDGSSSNNAMSVLYGSSSVRVTADSYGLAGITPSTGGSGRAVDVVIVASAGNAVLQFEMEALWPIVVIATESDTGPPTGTSPRTQDLNAAPSSQSTASENTPSPDTTPSTSETVWPPTTVRGRRLIGHDPRGRARPWSNSRLHRRTTLVTTTFALWRRSLSSTLDYG
jgi:hypothetical protein